MDLVKQEFWDNGYQNFNFNIAHLSDPIRLLIEKHIPHTKNGKAIEIGCYPGRYLSVLGMLGYEVNGIDLTPNTRHLINWLKENEYRTGFIKKQDFYQMEAKPVFDVVTSFGFIEHFTDYKKILEKHADLVKPGGKLLVTTPNFTGFFQKLLHHYLDRTNLKRHNLLSMEPKVWSETLTEKGFKIDYRGYFSYFNFWAEDDDQTKLQKILIQIIQKTLPLTSRILPNNTKIFSPYCGVVATKKVR